MSSAASNFSSEWFENGPLNAVCDHVLGAYWLILTLKSTVFFSIPSFQGMYTPLYPLLALGALRGLAGPRARLSAVPMLSYYVFLLSALLALLVSDVVLTVETARRLFTYIFGAIALLNCLRDRSIRFLMTAQVLSAIIVSSWVIYTAWATGFGYRGGIEINWNYVSVVIASGVLVLALYCYDHLAQLLNPRILLAMAALTAGLYSLFLLASRGTVVAFAAALPLVVVGRSKAHIVRATVGLAFFAAAAYGVAHLPGGETLMDRALSDRVESLNFRLPIWEAILTEYSKGSPWDVFVGRGIDSGEYLVGSTVVGLGTLHNGFLQVLFEEGLLGLSAFLGIHLWCIWRLCFGVGPGRQSALVIVAFCMVSNLSGSYEHMFEYWMMLAASVAVSLKMKRRQQMRTWEPIAASRMHQRQEAF